MDLIRLARVIFLGLSVPLAARAELAPLLVLYPVISVEKVVQSSSGR